MYFINTFCLISGVKILIVENIIAIITLWILFQINLKLRVKEDVLVTFFKFISILKIKMLSSILVIIYSLYDKYLFIY